MALPPAAATLRDTLGGRPASCSGWAEMRERFPQPGHAGEWTTAALARDREQIAPATTANIAAPARMTRAACRWNCNFRSNASWRR